MQKIAPYIIGGIVIIFVIVGGVYLFKNKTPSGGEPVTEQPAPQEVATSTYATTTYSIVHPNDFSVDETYAYSGVPNKPIHGVKFVIPLTVATGTNLSADSGVAVEELPRAKNCTADIFFYDNVKASSETINGISYSIATSSDAGAGNLYEEQIFAREGSHPCTAVRYLIHSTQIGNYPEGTVRAFDRDALLASFDKIRDSLTLNQ